MANQSGQSERVYIAQEKAHVLWEGPLATGMQMQRFVDDVLTDSRVISRYHPKSHQVPVSFDWLEDGEMAITYKHRVTGELHIVVGIGYGSRRNLLHEVAHVLIQEPDGDEHNAEWAACYLQLLQWFDETPFAEALAREFKTYNVRVAHVETQKEAA